MIEHFKSDEYSWLSNFAPCKIILDGIEYASVEHAYISTKSDNQEWKIFCKNEPKAGKVKRASSDITLVNHPNLHSHGLLASMPCLSNCCYTTRHLTTAPPFFVLSPNWSPIQTIETDFYLHIILKSAHEVLASYTNDWYFHHLVFANPTI